MGSLRIRKNQLCYLQFLLILLIQNRVLCYQYKVGDLHAWGLPVSSNQNVYTKWSKSHNFKIGDSLMFLYPPSQDSLVQVTGESYSTCKLTDPILYMNNGNSLFNFTSPGDYYFTSGQQGHCEKSQKLYISVLSANGSSSSSSSASEGPTALPAISPSYTNVFGSIPAPPASSSPSVKISVVLSATVTFLIFVLFPGNI